MPQACSIVLLRCTQNMLAAEIKVVVHMSLKLHQAFEKWTSPLAAWGEVDVTVSARKNAIHVTGASLVIWCGFWNLEGLEKHDAIITCWQGIQCHRSYGEGFPSALWER